LLPRDKFLTISDEDAGAPAPDCAITNYNVRFPAPYQFQIS